MKGLIVISVIVGAVVILVVATDRAESKEYAEALATYSKRTASYGDQLELEYKEARARESLIGSFGIVGTILLWLVGSLLGRAGLWFLLGMLDVAGVAGQMSQRTRRQITTYVELSDSGEYDRAYEYATAAAAGRSEKPAGILGRVPGAR